MSKWTELIPCPPKSWINNGRDPCPTKLLVARHGMPGGPLTDQCGLITKPYWYNSMVLKEVGPFRVRGHKLAVALLERSLLHVKNVNPQLYEVLGTAGMLCYRRVRGSVDTLSNHGAGFAVDFLIDGKLDQRGDNKCFRGSMELYSQIKQFGWWWGAGFSTEDSMHFEPSRQIIERWISEGLL